MGNVPKGLALKMFTCESFRSQLKQLAANVLSLFYAGGKHDVSFERVSRLSFLSEAHAPGLSGQLGRHPVPSSELFFPGQDSDGFDIEVTKPRISSTEHVDLMMRFIWSFLDLHFTKQDCVA